MKSRFNEWCDGEKEKGILDGCLNGLVILLFFLFAASAAAWSFYYLIFIREP